MALDLNQNEDFMLALGRERKGRQPGSKVPTITRFCESCGAARGVKKRRSNTLAGKAGSEYFVVLCRWPVKLLDGRFGGFVELCKNCETKLRALGVIVENA